ncbi:MAG: WG repeat-containing protein [Clostridiales bacterium]|nr:WG repeat-containing protein [Clostridiales bacterium]
MNSRSLTGFVYEEARTAANGRAWVMENGEWAVVSLSEQK